jgi:hypothetical protein
MGSKQKTLTYALNLTLSLRRMKRYWASFDGLNGSGATAAWGWRGQCFTRMFRMDRKGTGLEYGEPLMDANGRKRASRGSEE